MLVYWEVKVQLHSFFTSVLDELSGQLHATATWPRGKSPWYPLNRTLGGSQYRSVRCRESNNSSSQQSNHYGHRLHYSSVIKHVNNQLCQSQGAAVRSFWNCETGHSRLSSTEVVVPIFLSLQVAFCGSLQSHVDWHTVPWSRTAFSFSFTTPTALNSRKTKVKAIFDLS